MSPPLETPVAVFIFNRPALAAGVVEAIRPARPRRLFVVADGPRADVPGEAERCARTVAAVTDNVDWDCEVTLDVADTNLGCGPRVSSGITGVLAAVDRAILIEDDCRPDPSFFPFCEELLERYADDTRVGAVCGTSFEGSKTADSYFFSAYPPIWGWATWRRAWDGYDLSMPQWPELRDTAKFREYVGGSARSIGFWTSLFDAVKAGQVNTWDAQWMLQFCDRDLLAVQPARNLVENVGFGDDSTHTAGPAMPVPSRKSVTFPIRHPASVARDVRADRATMAAFVSRRHAIQRRLGAVAGRLRRG